MSARKYSTEELAEFERAMGIALPDSYKRYLIEIGAGEHTGSKVSLLEEWCQPYCMDDGFPEGFLAQPFPFNERWNDLALFDPKAPHSPYFDRMLFRGAMRIRNLGDEGYHLLVVSGLERGNVWCDERVSFGKGIYPLPDGSDRRVTIDEYLA